MERSVPSEAFGEREELMRYEVTYLTRSEEELGGVSDLLAGLDARVESQAAPFRRKLAYPISREQAAVYHTIVFEADPHRIQELTAKLNRNDLILRHLLVAGGIRKGVETPRKLKDKDLEVAASLAKGMEELAAADAARGVTPTAESVTEPIVTAEVAAEPVKEAEKPAAKKQVAKKEISAEELTAEDRQKKLDEKLKSILGE